MSGAEMFRSPPVRAYDRFVGRYGAALAAALLDFAGVGRGVRALDVGCGPGALTSALADRLGAEQVCAAEPSEPFAAACRERVPGATVVIAGAERLPFEDGSFDATLSQLVVNFMGDPERGIREMARVTAPGGVVAACVWDYAGEMTLLRGFWDAARDSAIPGAAEADEANMPWCREGDLAELWRGAGLDPAQTGALVVSAGYTDFDDLWEPFLQGIGPAGAFCAGLAPEHQDILGRAFRERLGVGDTPFELTARAWAVSATR